MKNKEYRDYLKRCEDALKDTSMKALEEGWDIQLKSISKLLQAIDTIKEARVLA